jgi:O-antigen ligase
LSWMSTFTGQHHAKVVPGSRFAEAASGESKSTSDRLYYLGSAFDMWLAHPWGGTGAGTYRDVHPQYQKRVISASSNAHNFYVQTLAELGLVGTLALVAVMLWLLAGGLRGLVAEPEMVPVAIGAAGGGPDGPGVPAGEPGPGQGLVAVAGGGGATDGAAH